MQKSLSAWGNSYDLGGQRLWVEFEHMALSFREQEQAESSLSYEWKGKRN